MRLLIQVTLRQASQRLLQSLCYPLKTIDENLLPLHSCLLWLSPLLFRIIWTDSSCQKLFRNVPQNGFRFPDDFLHHIVNFGHVFNPLSRFASSQECFFFISFEGSFY